MSTGDKTRSNAIKLWQGRLRLNIWGKKTQLRIKIVKHRKRLPREVLESSLLEVFKSRFDKYVRNWFTWTMTPKGSSTRIFNDSHNSK